MSEDSVQKGGEVADGDVLAGEVVEGAGSALVPLRVAAERNPALVYLASLSSAHSRRMMGHALNIIAFALGAGRLPETGRGVEQDDIDGLGVALGAAWGQVRYQHTAAVRALLQGRYAPATTNTYLAALRGVLLEAWRLGLLDAERYQRAVDFRVVSQTPLPSGRDLSVSEIAALLVACTDDANGAAGARDAGLIAVLYAGARRSEAARLDLADYETESGQLTIRGGKRRKDRVTYVDPGGQLALADWLAVRGGQAGPLFLAVNKGGRIQHEQGQLTAQAVYNRLVVRGREAGLADFSPHDFRRTVIGDLLDAGVDIATVARMMGHADVKTTARYDRRPDRAKAKAAGKVRLPYRRRERLV